jgi:hypothetical protein
MPTFNKPNQIRDFILFYFFKFQMLHHWLASQEGLGFTTKLKVESKSGENVLVILSQKRAYGNKLFPFNFYFCILA